MDEAGTFYKVRQYVPSFVSGVDLNVVENVPYKNLLEQSWMDSFRRDDFDHFEISPFGEELIIDAHYKSGAHWVVGFAAKMGTPAAEGWRYNHGNVSP